MARECSYGQMGIGGMALRIFLTLSFHLCLRFARYDGEWKDDKPNGRGVKIWARGDRYEGEWKDGKQFGKGILHHPDGRSEDGFWDNDLPHGGRIHSPEKNSGSGLTFDSRNHCD